MKLRIGEYLDNEIKTRNISKKELYDKLKESFHINEENYVQYKGFTARFYGKLYAEDLLEISYLLGIDLNQMRDILFDKHKVSDSLKIQEALIYSKYAKNSEYYSRWSCVEKDLVYIVWFKESEKEVDVKTEVYNLSQKTMYDISYLNYEAITALDEDWHNKDFENKMRSIKKINRSFYDKCLSEKIFNHFNILQSK